MQESSSGMVTMSMDMSVTMDISEQQEQSMDMTLEHTESAANAMNQDTHTIDTPANQPQIPAVDPQASSHLPVSAETFVRPDHNPMKRRRLVNSKLDYPGLVCIS